MFKIHLVFVFLVSSSNVWSSNFCKNEKVLTVSQQLGRLKPSTDLDIIDLDPIPSGSFIAGYEYEVEPAYTKGLFSRIDRWQIKTSYLPSRPIEISDSIKPSISGGVKSHLEATYIRFMSNPCSAMLALPLTPKHLPLSAKNALTKKFKVGDYFLLKGSVGFVVSGGIVQAIGSSAAGVSVGGSYLVDGAYQLHLVRLDNKHVRLKIIAQRRKSFSVKAALGYETEFDVFSISRLNDELEKIVSTEPVKIAVSKTKSNVFMVDYLLNLTDKEVANAFEKVLAKVKDFKRLQLANPFRNQRDLENSLLLDLTPLEDIFRRDYEQNNIERLKRNLRSSSDQKTYGFGLEVDNKIVGFKVNGQASSANIGIRQPNNSLERYILKSWDQTVKGNLIFGWSKTNNGDGTRVLYTANEKFEEQAPINIVKYEIQKKNTFSYASFEELQLKIKKYLPLEVLRLVNWNQWGQEKGEKYTNYGLRFEFIMDPQVLNKLPSLSKDKIHDLFISYLNNKNLKPDDFFYPIKADKIEVTVDQQFKHSLHFLSKNLSAALDKKLSLKERVEWVARSRKTRLFDEAGIGFLMSLNPALISEYYHVRLNVSSSESIYEFLSGNEDLTKLYRKIITIKAALDDDGLDILREAESISSEIKSFM